MVGRRVSRDPIEIILEIATNSKRFNELYHKDPFLYDEFVKRGIIVNNKIKEAEDAVKQGVYVTDFILPGKYDIINYDKIAKIFIQRHGELLLKPCKTPFFSKTKIQVSKTLIFLTMYFFKFFTK